MASTLTHQSARKAIDELATNTEEFAKRFTDYAPEEQQALLRQMGKGIAQLKELEQKWKLLSGTMATTDSRIFVEDSETPEDGGDWAKQRADLKYKWEWLDAEPRRYLC